MNNEQREKLKIRINDIIIDYIRHIMQNSRAMDIAEEILQEVERHEWKKSDGIMEYAGALSKESVDKLRKFTEEEKVQ